MSISRIRARGCGLRSVAPHSIPSAHRSDEYAKSPLTLGMPSGRRRLSPIPPRIVVSTRHTTTSCIRRLARRCRARSSSSSPVVSRPSSTTGRPPTSSVSTRGRGPSTSAATGSAMPAWSRSSSRHSATSASLPGSSEPISVLAAEAAGAVDGAQRQRLARGQRLRAAVEPRHEQRLAQLAGQLAGLVGRGAVDAEADRRAGRRERRHRRDAGAEARVRGRAVRDAGAGLAEPAHLALVEVHAVGEPDVVAEPADLLEVLDRPHAEQLEAELLLVERLGHVGVQPHAALPRELGGLGHQLLRDAERRARARARSGPSRPAPGRGSGRSRRRRPAGSRRGPR